ncbi:IS3 family transposase [sulfur-oxidizing endosymbiont of Gigantopelta aegis]|uniref:IS3 family transposase n=1 Tax=sulfur-oxidizing endosymbiont of Gigantopelta aegis TaxID=2794934 RepID=UPI001BE4AF4A|nr:IS3 family transposase [sulfur-oxidizing endosymbiont of Gigantopelta aegis]
MLHRKEHPQLSIKKQCELIGLNRSSYYYQPKKPLQNKDLTLMNLIDELYIKHPFYGSRQIRNALRLKCYKINRKKFNGLCGSWDWFQWHQNPIPASLAK